MQARRRAETRDAVLAAAAAELAARGYDGASIRTIARRAGVATGTVLTVAPTKLALMHRVLAARLDDVVARALRVPDRGTVVDQLVAVAGVFFDAYAADRDVYVALLSRSLFEGGDAGRAFEAQVRAVAEDAGRRIARGHPGVDVEGATLAFVGAYYFALLGGLRDPAPDTARMRALVRRPLAALLGDEKPPPRPRGPRRQPKDDR